MALTLSGTYTSTVSLTNPAVQNPATITSTGLLSVNSANTFVSALYGTLGTAWSVTNQGTIQSFGSSGRGIFLASGGSVDNTGTIFAPDINGAAIAFNAGGTVTNGRNGASGALIQGGGGVAIRDVSGTTGSSTVANYGRIIGTGSRTTVYFFHAAGTVINGAAASTSALISSNLASAVHVHDIAGTVVNYGTILQTGHTSNGNGQGIFLGAGGGVTNGAGGTISSYHFGINSSNGQYAPLAATTIVNSGLIVNTGSTSGGGVNIGGGGTVTNNAGATISAIAGNAIAFSNSAGTVVNLGVVLNTSTASPAVRLSAGGEVTNYGEISGVRTGVSIGGSAGTINNFGTVISTAPTSATAGAAVYLQVSGAIVNQRNALLTAERVGVSISNTLATSGSVSVANAGIITGSAGIVIGSLDTGNNTVVNYGTISGTSGSAIRFRSGNDLLVLHPGSVLNGTVNADTGSNTLELTGGGSGSLAGLGTKVIGFSTLQFDTGAAWTVEGTIAGIPGIITGFVATDAIVVDGFVAVSELFTASGLLLTDAANNQITLGFQGGYVTSDFRVASVNSGTGTQVTVAGPQQSPIILNDFGWAQGWGSPDNPRITADVDSNGSTDYVGFGYQAVFISYGGTFSNGQNTGPGFTNAVASVQDFGTAEGYTASVQRGVAATGAGVGDTIYGQGFAGVYWYAATGATPQTDANGHTINVLQYQSTPNLYANFGSQQGWTPDNGFQILKTSVSDSYASILGFGFAGIVVGPQAFAPGADASGSYVIPFAAGNGSGWSQSVDIRTFQAGDGSTIDLNHDGIADFVGMGPQGLSFAFGNTAGPGGAYGLGDLQSAHISGGNTDLGEAQGWTNATTLRYVVADQKTGFDDILAFGAAGVYVAMGQDPAAHGGEPFGQLYLAMPDFGSNQGWSVSQTPRIVGDVNGDGTPDIVGFGANSTFAALGSRDANNNLFFNVDPSQTINDFGFNEAWSGADPQTVRTLGDVAGTGHSDLILSGAFDTQVWQYGTVLK